MPVASTSFAGPAHSSRLWPRVGWRAHRTSAKSSSLVSRFTSLSTFQGAALFAAILAVFRIGSGLDRLRTGLGDREYEVHQIHESIDLLSPCAPEVRVIKRERTRRRAD